MQPYVAKFNRFGLVSAFLISTSLTISAPTPVQADAGDFLGGVGVGVGGTLLYQHIRRNQQRRAAPRRYYKPRTRYSAPRYRISDVPADRNQIRDYQARLNMLGFNAGSPDGIPGPRTRRAVVAFQSSIGSAATGRLSRSDVSVLVQRTTVAATPAATVGSQSGGSYPVAAAPAAGQPAGSYTPQVDTGAAYPTAPDAAAAYAPEATAAYAPEAQQALPPIDDNSSQQGVQQQTAALPVAPAPQSAATQPHSSGMAGVSQYKPAIFGITPGDEFSSVSAKLIENGFTSCSDEQGTMVCDKDDGTIIDKVVISHKAGSGGSDNVYLAAREISFAKPVSRSFLLQRMASAYPELLNAPGYTIAKASCQEHLNSKSEKPIPVHFTNAIEGKDDMGTFLAACPSYYAIRFEEADASGMLKSATITFFDGTLIEDVPASTGVAAGAGQNQVESEVGEALKF